MFKNSTNIGVREEGMPIIVEGLFFFYSNFNFSIFERGLPYSIRVVFLNLKGIVLEIYPHRVYNTACKRGV